jgi:hypothetical protein
VIQEQIDDIASIMDQLDAIENVADLQDEDKWEIYNTQKTEILDKYVGQIYKRFITLTTEQLLRYCGTQKTASKSMLMDVMRRRYAGKELNDYELIMPVVGWS